MHVFKGATEDMVKDGVNEWPPTWAEFKARIKGLYPGSDITKDITYGGLKEYVVEVVKWGIWTNEELGEYEREFKQQS